MARKAIGIIGGMGPEATADLFYKIIKATPATVDQDHIRVLIDSRADLPDRTCHIEGRGPSPLPGLIEMAQGLERSGAGLLVMPCNTAHYYYDAIVAAVGIPFLHIARVAAAAAAARYPSARRCGLLGTTATVKMRLYHEALAAVGLDVVVPDDDGQRAVDSTIFGPDGIKAGQYERPARILREQSERLIAAGADLIVLGCTELPLALRDGDVSRPVLDATQTLAEAAVAAALAGAAAWPA